MPEDNRSDEMILNVEERYKNQYITVSNPMIRARENTTLLESKIEALAMYYMGRDMRQKVKKDANGVNYRVNYVVIPAREVSALMSREYSEKKKTDGKTYNDIRKAAISMKQKFFIIENREENRFLMRSMYGDVAYDDGELYVEFEPSMEKYFMDLKQNFSKLKLPILFSYRKNGGFQLYRLLKSYAYPPSLADIDMSLTQEELPSIKMNWNLTDLRMIMGYVDISQNVLQEEGSKKKPDWKKMEKAEKNPHYKRWSDFNARVIEPGVQEINELSDLYIKEVIKETSGKGAKVTGLTFVVQHNKAYYEKHGAVSSEPVKPKELTLEEIEDFLDELSITIKERMRLKDLKSIAEASGYDLDRIKEVYSMASESGDLHNLTGWMITALKKGYSPHIKKDKPRTDSFEERVYDYDELAKNFVKN